MKHFYLLSPNLGLSTVHINVWRFFAQRISAKRGKFPLLIAFLLAPSGCGVNRAWLQRDIRKGTLVHCRALRLQINGEQVCGGWVFEHP